MVRTFVSPGKYYQGAGIMKELGNYASSVGKSALILISAGGRSRFSEMIDESFEGTQCSHELVIFNGECTQKEIERIKEKLIANKNDLIIAVGGGKILDTSKAAADYCDIPVIICPTIAGTDAPCSALSVVYTEDGEVERYFFLKRNPHMVIMDTQIIAASPLRMTVSGMGDALATYLEARACYKNDGPNFANGKGLHIGIAIAKLCYDTLLEDGYNAKIALEQGMVTPAVEAVIEANTLLSGLGFESGGVAGAHAVHNGFCSLPECHSMLHGEKVAFGIITQLVLEHAPNDELNEVLDFCVKVGLPVTMAEIGVTEAPWEKILKVAEIACGPEDTAKNLPFEVDPVMVANAIYTADAYGKKALEAGKCI